MEPWSMEQKAIEKEIMEKAREWMTEYGEEFLVELIDVFLDEAPSQLAQLQRAADDRDAAVVSREAHTLKSSSANLGAMSLSAIAQQIETSGRSGRTENLDVQVRQLAATFDEVKTALEALRHGPARQLGYEI